MEAICSISWRRWSYRRRFRKRSSTRAPGSSCLCKKETHGRRTLRRSKVIGTHFPTYRVCKGRYASVNLIRREAINMLRLALIGCGSHSEIAHASALAHYVARHPGDVDLAATCDIDIGRA